MKKIGKKGGFEMDINFAERNVYAYMRISTNENRELQRFSRQKQSLEKFAKENNFEYLIMFKDDCSGATFDRKEWKKLEKIVKNGDVILFKDLSRFTRDYDTGLEMYKKLLNRGVEMIFLDNPTISTPYIKKMSIKASEEERVTEFALNSIITLILIVELDRVAKEREIFLKRIKDGIKSSDKRSGRKPNSLIKMTDELEQDIRAFMKDRNVKQVDLMRKHNISRNTLKKYVKIIEEKMKNE